MPPSSNWFALKKNLKGTPKHDNDRPTKRRKVETMSKGTPESESSVVPAPPNSRTTTLKSQDLPTNRESVEFLRKMVYGQVDHPPAHLLPGKYLAIDCEMVGIAGDPKNPSLPGQRNQGDESSLARVSVVNYFGAVQLDVFVRQRERVTDWRTAFSGVRESDMVNAKPFSEVQKLVSDLLKDRILVGHAVHNDLKVLLLSHPYNMTRDTQTLAGLHGTLAKPGSRAAVASSGTAMVDSRRIRRPALRKLVSQELNIEIQTGEHSSVIDARATMAIYRLHRKTWDQSILKAASVYEWKQAKLPSNALAANKITTPDSTAKVPSVHRKRSQGDVAASSDDSADGAADETSKRPEVIHERHPKKRKATSGQRKGPSTGFSVVVRKRHGGEETKHVVSGTRGGGSIGKDNKWWGTLG